MLPAVVFAIYRVAVENQPAFMGVVQEKLDFFHKMKYRTGRDPILLRSKNDPEIIIDIFEWSSEDAIAKAHKDPEVRKRWDLMEKLWIRGGIPLAELSEANNSFANFEPIDLL
jgi:hypothetical protein